MRTLRACLKFSPVGRFGSEPVLFTPSSLAVGTPTPRSEVAKISRPGPKILSVEKSKQALNLLATAAFAVIFTGCIYAPQITTESLLDEMVDREAPTRLPEPWYTSHQQSSHDRRTVEPDAPGWFANNDGFGIIRVDSVDGRAEKVMFDERGPGVITRIWVTTLDKRGMWRFYFDDTEEPELVIPAYDPMEIGVEGLGAGLLQAHTSYTPEGKGGATLFLPIPYYKACRITFEDAPGVESTPKYYGINYRKYPAGTRIETFSQEVAQRAARKIADTDAALLNPVAPKGVTLESTPDGNGAVIELPAGPAAVGQIVFGIEVDPAEYANVMDKIVLTAKFDGKETVRVPLADFSGGGAGAPPVESWWIGSDGRGTVICRWMMPYGRNGELRLIYNSDTKFTASMTATIVPYDWDANSMYLHAAWKEERGIHVHNNPDEWQQCIDWNFATIEGRGVYMGDVLSLYNHTPAWYGEGDEKIWVDNEAFPSHLGTGTEDYYNSSWAPVVPFHTPFGGAPRADEVSSHGYNTFFRTRILDGIPFREQLRFDIEMLSWQSGTVDYRTTVWWYGDV